LPVHTAQNAFRQPLAAPLVGAQPANWPSPSRVPQQLLVDKGLAGSGRAAGPRSVLARVRDHFCANVLDAISTRSRLRDEPDGGGGGAVTGAERTGGRGDRPVAEHQTGGSGQGRVAGPRGASRRGRWPESAGCSGLLTYGSRTRAQARARYVVGLQDTAVRLLVRTALDPHRAPPAVGRGR